ncbi:unnamed protein product, partial [Toxocara canis]|uniref:Protein kinase domain-containing protein n=1 Tax=Toxocara canis TaxID=6265 RepID=A0A183UXT7_TOXCA
FTNFKGLEYLYVSPIGFHGSLSPRACLIDRNWVLKVTDFGIAESIDKWEKLQITSVEEVKADDDRSGVERRTKLLKNREKHRLRRLDQEWVKQTMNRRQ